MILFNPKAEGAKQDLMEWQDFLVVTLKAKL